MPCPNSVRELLYSPLSCREDSPVRQSRDQDGRQQVTHSIGVLPLNEPCRPFVCNRCRQTCDSADVLTSLLGMDDASLKHVLHAVADERPSLGLRLGEHANILSHVANGKFALSELSVESTHEKQDSAASTCIQFASPVFYVRDDDSSVDVEIFRTGDKRGRSEVHFRTKAVTPSAVEHYVDREGTVVFEPGQDSVIETFEIVGKTTWVTHVRFRVMLLAESVTDTINDISVHERLSTARVDIVGSGSFPYTSRIVDDDEVPQDSPSALAQQYSHDEAQETAAEEDTDSVKAEDEDDEADKEESAPLCCGPQPANDDFSSRVKLYFGFLRLLWSNPIIRCSTIKRCLKDQLYNAQFIINQYITLYTINVLFISVDDGDERDFSWAFHTGRQGLAAIVGIQLLCTFLCHSMEYVSCTWSIGGPARKLIQQGLLGRYFYYQSHHGIRPGDMTMAITRDSLVLVSSYGMAMRLFTSMTGVVAIVVFKITAPIIFHKHSKYRAVSFVPFVVYPVALGLVAILRSRLTTSTLEEVDAKQSSILEYVNRVISGFSIVRDYEKRHVCVVTLGRKIGAWNAAHRKEKQIRVNNNFFPKWVSTFLIAFWYWYFGGQVLDGTLTLGFFLADLGVISKFGKEMESVYQLVMKIEATFPDLGRVVFYLNQNTQINFRVQKTRARIQETKALRQSVKYCGDLNRIPISIRNVKFTFGRPFFFNGDIEIRQGQKVCFVGRHGVGRSILLKVITGAIIPDDLEGRLFIPSHLRLLHVDLSTVFLRGTLLEALTWGAQKEDRSIERVTAILKQFGLPSDGLHSDSKAWHKNFTHQEVHKLSLVRALVSNPHVLCIEKPAYAMSFESTELVMKALSEFVGKRGLGLSSDEYNNRIPRTLIYTSFHKAPCSHADTIYQVNEGVISQVTDLDGKAATVALD